jgi:hypothetical protein
MKNKKVLIVLLIAASAALITIFFTLVLPAVRMGEFKAYAIKQGQHVLGKDAVVFVSDGDPQPAYNIKRDSLRGEFLLYDRIDEIKAILGMKINQEQQLQMQQLSAMLKICEYSNDDPPEIDIQYWGLMNELRSDNPIQFTDNEKLKMRKQLDSLQTALPRSYVCFTNEVATFIRNVQNGQYHDVSYNVHTIIVDIPMGKYSIHESFTANVYPNQPYPSLTKGFTAVLCKYITFKKEMCK